MQIEITHPDGTEEAWNVDVDGQTVFARELDYHDPIAWWQWEGIIKSLHSRRTMPEPFTLRCQCGGVAAYIQNSSYYTGQKTYICRSCKIEINV